MFDDFSTSVNPEEMAEMMYFYEHIEEYEDEEEEN